MMAYQKGSIAGRHDIPALERLSLRIAVNDNGCFVWQRGTTARENGYGRITVNGHKTLAHRFSFEIFVRTIPATLTLDHLCRNRLCINPSHLIPKTQHANILVGNSKIATLAIADKCVKGHEFSVEFYRLHGRLKFRRYCLPCRRHTSAISQRRRYVEHQEKGLCVKCFNDAIMGIFCEVHYGG